MAAPAPAALVTELSAHPALEPLIARVRAAALDAARARRSGFLREPTAPSSEAPTLDSEQAETRFGNVLALLERGASSETDALLASVLLCLGVAQDFPSAPETEQARASELVFLAAHTPCNALGVADAVLGEERTRPLWRAVASLADPARAGAADQAEAYAALALLAAQRSEAARAAAAELAARTADPTVRALLSAPSAAEDAPSRLAGELTPGPHGSVGVTLLALTGILFLLRVTRLLARLALGFKQPAELRLSERGLEIAERTELLGRVLRTRQTLVPLANLARVTREVRYPRLGLYLGLAALALGSYLGMGLFVDGARVPGGSAPLLGMGLLIVVLGLCADFGLTTLADNVRGRCRVLVVPKKGKRLSVGALDPARADAMLNALAALTRS
jgi:hypothetical protein